MSVDRAVQRVTHRARPAQRVTHRTRPAARATRGPRLPVQGTQHLLPVTVNLGGGTGHVHVQDVAASVWTIEHHLGYDPGGITVEVGGVPGDALYPLYPVPGQVVILSFDDPVAGLARLS